MAADHRRTVRRARKLAWHRISRSDARRLLAAAEEMVAASTDARELVLAEEAVAEARAILISGGMRLCEAYRDSAIPGSDVSLSRYEAYKRAHGQAAVRVGRDGADHVWWYRDVYYVASSQLPADAIERFARMEEAEERRRLERFRAGIATMSSSRRQQVRVQPTGPMSIPAITAKRQPGTVTASLTP